MTDVDNVMPLRPLGPRRKDPTAAERKRRSRAKKRLAQIALATPAASHDVTAPAVTRATVTAPSVPALGHGVAAATSNVGHLQVVDVAAYIVAVALAGATAYFSIHGMVTLFPDMAGAVTVLAIAMEAGKVVTAAVLGSRWHVTPWTWRIILMALIAGLALINAAGVASQLVAAHVGERGRVQSSLAGQKEALDARIAGQTHTVADLDRRLSQIDISVEEAARRGRTKTALAAIDGQRKARAALVDERKREADVLTALQTEHASIAAKARQADLESAPIRYVAELIGATDTDSERAIRWLIALMVICADPTSLCLMAFVSARRNLHGNSGMSRDEAAAPPGYQPNGAA
jgi:hypothetical protein